MPLTILFLIRNLGDYHTPRLLELQTQAIKRGVRFHVVVFNQNSQFYSHKQSRSASLEAELSLIDLRQLSRLGKLWALFNTLRLFRPILIAQIGYHGALPFIGLIGSKLFGSKVVFCTDSKEDDNKRHPLAEFIKSIVLRSYDHAIVAGSQHKHYLCKLGFPAQRILIGYDVIDNNYFGSRSERFQSKRNLYLPSVNCLPYVLVVSRLVPRKRVNDAISIFFSSKLWQSDFKLLIIGSGPEKVSLQQQAEFLGIQSHVDFCGDVNNSRMPFFYGRATATLLCSEYDQWGLCINESMACSTPVIATQRCGAAGNLLIHERNGFVFDRDDPLYIEKAALLLHRISTDFSKGQEFANNAKLDVSRWSLALFANNVLKCHNDADKNAR